MSSQLAFLFVQMVAFGLLWFIAFAGFRDSTLTSYHALGAACLVFSIVSVGAWRLFGVSMIKALIITVPPIMITGTVALCVYSFLI